MDKRSPGRPRLATPERRQNILASKAKWRENNREYYLLQKRQLASRPEYLARRRELWAQSKGYESHLNGDDHPGSTLDTSSKVDLQPSGTHLDSSDEHSNLPKV